MAITTLKHRRYWKTFGRKGLRLRSKASQPWKHNPKYRSLVTEVLQDWQIRAVVSHALERGLVSDDRSGPGGVLTNDWLSETSPLRSIECKCPRSDPKEELCASSTALWNPVMGTLLGREADVDIQVAVADQTLSHPCRNRRSAC